MKRLLLYVHYNQFDEISPHVLYQLEQLRPFFSSVCFISNSQLNSRDIEILISNKLIDKFIQRKNEGYDFAAWKEAFQSLTTELISFESVTLMNDTCFGPLWDMKPIFSKFESDETVDFWGLTNHPSYRISWGKTVPEHLQSYFLSFKKNVIKSKVFCDFWSNVESLNEIQHVIDLYESKLTQKLLDGGFRYASLLDLSHNNEFGNVSIFRPDIIVDHRIPFIKVKSFSYATHLAPIILKAIEETSDYPNDLIVKHLSTILPPNTSFLFPYKMLKTSSANYMKFKMIVLHFHFSTLNGIEIIVNFLKEHRQIVNLVSAESEVILTEIKKRFQSENLNIYSSAHISKMNDRQKFINHSLSKLDINYLAYIHVSNFFANKLVNNYSLKELLEIMLLSNNSVQDEFNSNERLALAIPDCLTYEREYKCHSFLKFENLYDDIFKYTDSIRPEPLYARQISAYWIRSKTLIELLTEKSDMEHFVFDKLIPIFVWQKHFDFVILPNKTNVPTIVDANKAYELVLSSELKVPDKINYPVKAIDIFKFFIRANILSFKYFTKRLNIIKLFKGKQKNE
ncbi:rhamnan synthesis F family protein [Streptococcus uberis]|uniref:rhamnan synthesis F family protein n=3 Tax=Streptococcus uberis TaxID=1349 RepID=UPI001939693C|nr:rhamnan synthesis F family protein [Streptococcus uberis]